MYLPDAAALRRPDEVRSAAQSVCEAVELAAKELQALWQLEVQPLARQSTRSLQTELETRCVLAAEAPRLKAERLRQQLPRPQGAPPPLSLEFWALP